METRSLGRGRRAIASVAKVFGLTLTFAAAAAGGAALHVGLGAPRRFVVGQVNAALDGSFKGKLVVRDLGALGLTHLGGLALDIFDPEGHEVAAIDGVKIRFATVTLIESLLGKGDLKVVVTSADVDGAAVTLDADDRGNLGIARAFEAKEPSASPSSTATDVEVKSLKVKHLWVHGEVSKGAPKIDADVDALELALSTDPKATKIDVGSATLTARGLEGKNPVGVLRARVSIPGEQDPHGELAASGRFDGKVGEVRVSLEGQKSGKRVDAVVSVPRTEAASVRALAPDIVTVTVPVSLHAEVHGTLPRLEPKLHATAGDATVDVVGAVVVPLDGATDTTVDVDLAAADVDASVLAKGAPKTGVTAKLGAHAVIHPAGKVDGTYTLDAEAGEAAGQMTPAVAAKGSFTEKSIEGDAHVAEPGAPTDLHFALSPDDKTDKPTRLAVLATTKADLSKIVRVKGIGRGRADTKIDAHLDLATHEVRADASGAVWGFSNPSLSVKVAAFQASVRGTTESPRFALRLDGGGLAASGRTFTGIHADLFGSPKAVSVGVELHGDEPTPSIDARAVVSLEHGVGLDAVRVRVLQGDETAIATVKHVRIAGESVRVDGLRVEGLGDPIEGDFSLAGKRLAVRGKAADVDLARVAALLARPEDAKGHLGFTVDLATDRRTTHGKLVVDLEGGEARTLKDIEAHVALEIAGEDVRADVRAAMGDAGHFSLTTNDLKLGHPGALDAESWLAATGRAALEGTIDLAKLAAALPDVVPVATAAGVVSLRAGVERARSSEPPVLDAKGETRGLLLVEKQKFETDAQGQLVLGPPARHLEGVDARFEAHVDPVKNKANAKLELRDKDGALATVDAAADAPLDAIFRGREGINDLFAKTRLDAHVTVPRREVARLPAVLQDRLPVTGAVSLEAEVKGTADLPELTLHARGERVVRKDAHKHVHPADVDVDVRYAAGSGRVRAAVDYDKQRVLDAAVNVDGVALDLRRGTPDLTAWSGSADVRLHEFPLGPVAAFTGQRMRGKISGAVAVRDLHRHASLGADLQFADLVLDETSMPRGFARVILKDGEARAGLRLEQKDGVAEVIGKGSVAWGKEIAPSLVADRGLDVHFAARNFRVDAAAPFVRSVLSELDGRVDAEVRAHLDPKTKQGKVDGSLALRDGVIEVPAIGERFHGVRTKVTMKPWGTLRVDDVEAFAPTGRLTAAAQARFDGLALRGGSVAIHIDQGEKVPIAIEGVPLGSAYGDIKGIAMLSADGKDMNVNVTVPMLGVVLPQSTGHTVQPLERDDRLRLGVHRDGRFAILPLGPPDKPREPSSGKIHAEVTLGDVRVKRDTTLDVRVTGKPIFDVTDATVAHGGIRITRGTLEVQGKRFTIDRGIVTFDGDPSQPEIVATAYWDAPDSTRVYADFAGTPKSGKLKLRAEPARTQDEIVALILFGSADGQLGASQGSSQESTAAKGAGAAGGVVTQGVNKAISGITTADIETRVDTSEADNPRPELAVQLTQRVSAQIAYNLGVPPPGSATDRTEVTLDFRFYRGWSVDTTVGDQGSTALDLVWRHRY